MYKDGQTFCLDLFISLLHKIGSCSNCSVYNAHLNFRGMQVFCVVLQKKCCSDHVLV